MDLNPSSSDEEDEAEAPVVVPPAAAVRPRAEFKLLASDPRGAAPDLGNSCITVLIGLNGSMLLFLRPKLVSSAAEFRIHSEPVKPNW